LAQAGFWQLASGPHDPAPLRRLAAARARLPQVMADEDGPPQPLSESLMAFSNIGRTVDGAGFAYGTITCTSRRLNQIKAIEPYAHVQFLDLSHNVIPPKEIGILRGLEHLVKLNLARNLLTNLQAWLPKEEETQEMFPFLRELDLSDNQLTVLPPLPYKALQKVSFARNDIASIQDFGGHAEIRELDLSGNKLHDLAGLAGLPALTSLEVSSNALMSITGLAEVPALQELRIARNPMETLEGPWQELGASPISLLDVSGCKIQSPQALEVLRNLPLLRTLEAGGNPFAEAAEAGAKVECLVCHWRLQTVNGEAVTEEELEKARELNVQRLEEKAAAEKAAAEEAAAAGEEE